MTSAALDDVEVDLDKRPEPDGPESPSPPPRTPPLAARRAKAQRWMRTVTMACAVLVGSITGQQLITNGWVSFITRPAGVGASASDDAPDTGASAPTTPTPSSGPTPTTVPGTNAADAPSAPSSPAAAPSPPPAANPAPAARPRPRPRGGAGDRRPPADNPPRNAGRA